MSELCPRGIKCPCFCCLETDCEKYENEPPEWIKMLLGDDSFGDTLIKIAEGMNNEEKQLIKIVNSALTETLCEGCAEELSPYSYENGGSCYKCREKAAKEIILIIKENNKNE